MAARARTPTGRPRTVAVARCPDPLHRRSHTSANGTRVSGGRRVRQYRCVPLVGEPHAFIVPLEGRRVVRDDGDAPACPQGHEATVRRNGLYGRVGVRRQRYFCPEGGRSGRGHSFTPPLPRAHIAPDKGQCPYCDEPRSVHHGDTAVARGHRWPTLVVARGLDRLAAGDSYTEVGRWAFEAAKRPIASRKRTAPPSGSDARRVWHVAADWTEAFSPVIWGPVEARLRAEAMAERARLDALIAAGLPLERPQVVLVDDVPVYGLTGRTRRRDGGFYVLVLAETAYTERGGAWSHAPRLRLVRGYAKSNSASWRLMFDDIAYTPDFIVADAGTGIAAAIAAHFGSRTVFVPSLYHISRSVLGAFGMRSQAARDPGVVSHVMLLGRGSPALASPADWSDWWDELARLGASRGLPPGKVAAQRRNYEADVARVLQHLAAIPDLTLATGGIEGLIRDQVDPLLELRTSLANAERTASLFDLAVARANSAFTDLGAVAESLREDARANGGFAFPLRAVEDPQPPGGRYSSLRDPNLLATLARAKGLR